MADRTDVVGGVWAEGAPDIPGGGTPAPSVTYANSLMDTAIINRAWPFSDIVASNNHNEIMRRITLLMIQLEKQGVLSYSVLTDYGIGALVLGSDAILYRAIVANGPLTSVINPIGNPGTWENAFVASGLWTELNPGGDIYRVGGKFGMGTAAPSKILEIVGLGATGMEYLFNDTGASLDGYQKLDVATAGFKLKGESKAGGNRVENASISLFQETNGQRDGYIGFNTDGGGAVSERARITSDGNMGIGAIPAIGTKLEVNGLIKITGGSPGVGKVLTSDAGGLANWGDPPASSLWTQSLLNDDIYRQLGNVGIGTDDATTELEVVGHITSKGTKWTTRATPENNEWRDITYGNGLFVAVASSGTNRVMTSPNGITWTTRSAAVATNWYGITYGDGLFVAVARDVAGDQVMYSLDGITWVPRSATQHNEWNDITYVNGLFVAVARTGSNRVMTSINGINWLSQNAATANEWNGITYGDGLFVAVASSGTNRVMTSPDGITWTSRSAAENNNWFGVTYGNGLFVAVATDGTNQVMTSPDGINWTTRSAAENNQWESVIYGNGIFVAVADTGTNRVMTSPNGITWTSRSAAENNNWFGVTYGNGIFAAVANNGNLNQVMTSGKTEINITPSDNIYQGGIVVVRLEEHNNSVDAGNAGLRSGAFFRTGDIVKVVP